MGWSLVNLGCVDGVEVEQMDDEEHLKEERKGCNPWGRGDGKPVQLVDEELRSGLLLFLFVGGLGRGFPDLFLTVGFHDFL